MALVRGKIVPQPKRIFADVDNFIYVYHLNKFLVLPAFPEDIKDDLQARFSTTEVLARSAPIFSYSNSGPRIVSFGFKLHRDLMNQVNYSNNPYIQPENKNDDYLDVVVNCIQALSVPEYTDATKMVNPPMVAVKIGNQIFCKGIMQQANLSYGLPLVETAGGLKYSMIDLSFSVNEVDAYTASYIAEVGSYRGLSKSLQRTISAAMGGESALSLTDISNPSTIYGGGRTAGGSSRFAMSTLQ